MTPFVPKVIREQTHAQRLDNILWEQRLYGYPPFGADNDQPMVCLSESPPDHLRWLLGNQHWPPWGLMFHRQDVYNVGGGPVWYTRQKQYDTLNQDQRPWVVRLDTSLRAKSDWLHEREWRIPLPLGYQGLNLGVVTVAAILIGTPTWQPSLRTVPMKTGYVRTGEPTHSGNPYGQPQIQHVPALPPLWQATPRWYWNSTTQKFLPA